MEWTLPHTLAIGPQSRKTLLRVLWNRPSPYTWRSRPGTINSKTKSKKNLMRRRRVAQPRTYLTTPTISAGLWCLRNILETPLRMMRRVRTMSCSWIPSTLGMTYFSKRSIAMPLRPINNRLQGTWWVRAVSSTTDFMPTTRVQGALANTWVAANISLTSSICRRWECRVNTNLTRRKTMKR